LNYCAEFKTFVLDFDGTLVEAPTRIDKQARKTLVPILKNVRKVAELSQNEKNQIIIMSARRESERELLNNFLKEYNINVHSLVLDCLHATRYLVNDFSGTTTKFPTAVAINLIRNSEDLEVIL